jgi:ABC-type transport system substrate-binding protein
MASMRLILSTYACLAVVSHAAGVCKKHTLDFILLKGDTTNALIEDDIRVDLAKVGITVNTRLLEKADFNKAMQQGDFHLCFTESWGPPYDPHSFATGWFRPNNEAHYPALMGMQAPMTNVTLQTMVTNVLKTDTSLKRQQGWTQILQEMHKQAISNPMWSRRMPAVFSRRLSGFTPGTQQYDYPMHLINVVSGSTSVTVSPGAQTGLFSSTGPMDPHSYRPNEFFISNWIYEGLVSYGSDGVILPQLATSWTVTNTAGGSQVYRFTLRTGVKFHDGTNFNCAAVKMTFDHVLQPPLNSPNYHGWYHLPKYLTSTACEGEVFVATMQGSYYPFLQEVSLIRPLRILSPNCYQNGPTSSSITHNSCPTKWDKPSGSNVRCVSVKCSAGTGPWKYLDKTLRADKTTLQMRLARNDAWWGARGGITELIVKSYTSAADVKKALLDESLDMVVGAGVLTPQQVKEMNNLHAVKFQVLYGPPLMNTIVVMNAAKAPTSDINLRKVIMHGIDKASIVDTELAGSSKVADSLFPKDAPFCNVDLTPRWDYDIEKAKLMNCPVITDAAISTLSVAVPVPAPAKKEDSNTGLILGLSLGIGIPLLLIIGGICFFVGKRSGYQQMEKGGGKPAASTVGSVEEQI